MIIYKKKWREAFRINQEANKWLECKIISKEQYESIDSGFKEDFYSPNRSIRIVLLLFTLVFVFGLFGLFFLVTGLDEADGGTFALIYGTLLYFILEILVKKKRLYKAGIDDALLLASCGLLLVAFISFLPNAKLDELELYLISLPLLLWFTMRFADIIIAFALNACIFLIVLILLTKNVGLAKDLLPFSVMVTSLAIYLFARKCRNSNALTPWRLPLAFFETSSLATIYLAGNLLMVSELFKLASLEQLSYILTAILPLLYISFGVLRRNAIMFRVGLLALVISIFSFKYHFNIEYTEVLLTIGGILLILIAKFGTLYLKTPKHGFTIEHLFKGDFEKVFNVDDMIIDKSLRKT